MSITTNAAIARIIEMLDADITHVGIGTGSNDPAVSDTLLDTEDERKASTNTVDSNTLIVEGYWDETEANGSTFLNAGCFCDGATGTVETGTLFAAGAIEVTKDNTQSLTISIEISVEAIKT